ncbi:hypothetical protein CYMTET_7624 [Cymbomonas tetramitiformis]|uniref:Uncharacterized protein n=1 Tax=Cymbomonas tetramitiformis TaxID=36881 RepID=A0AAE0GUP4_9CHLO|nr:hypothetical protein CYMTET_7624 [Cymbomonas tetramitiformis]
MKSYDNANAGYVCTNLEDYFDYSDNDPVPAPPAVPCEGTEWTSGMKWDKGTKIEGLTPENVPAVEGCTWVVGDEGIHDEKHIHVDEACVNADDLTDYSTYCSLICSAVKEQPINGAACAGWYAKKSGHCYLYSEVEQMKSYDNANAGYVCTNLEDYFDYSDNDPVPAPPAVPCEGTEWTSGMKWDKGTKIEGLTPENVPAVEGCTWVVGDEGIHDEKHIHVDEACVNADDLTDYSTYCSLICSAVEAQPINGAACAGWYAKTSGHCYLYSEVEQMKSYDNANAGYVCTNLEDYFDYSDNDPVPAPPAVPCEGTEWTSGMKWDKGNKIEGLTPENVPAVEGCTWVVGDEGIHDEKHIHVDEACVNADDLTDYSTYCSLICSAVKEQPINGAACAGWYAKTSGHCYLYSEVEQMKSYDNANAGYVCTNLEDYFDYSDNDPVPAPPAVPCEGTEWTSGMKWDKGTKIEGLTPESVPAVEGCTWVVGDEGIHDEKHIHVDEACVNADDLTDYSTYCSLICSAVKEQPINGAACAGWYAKTSGHCYLYSEVEQMKSYDNANAGYVCSGEGNDDEGKDDEGKDDADHSSLDDCDSPAWMSGVKWDKGDKIEGLTPENVPAVKGCTWAEGKDAIHNEEHFHLGSMCVGATDLDSYSSYCLEICAAAVSQPINGVACAAWTAKDDGHCYLYSALPSKTKDDKKYNSGVPCNQLQVAGSTWTPPDYCMYMPKPPSPNMPSPPPYIAIVWLSSTVNMDEAVLQNETFMETFEADYKEEVAILAGVEASDVHIVGYVAGSVVVETEIIYTDSAEQAEQLDEGSTLEFSDNFTDTYGATQATVTSVTVASSPPPVTSSSSEDGDTSSSGNNAGLMAGIVAACVCGVAVVAALAGWKAKISSHAPVAEVKDDMGRKYSSCSTEENKSPCQDVESRGPSGSTSKITVNPLAYGL